MTVRDKRHLLCFTWRRYPKGQWLRGLIPCQGVEFVTSICTLGGALVVSFSPGGQTRHRSDLALWDTSSKSHMLGSSLDQIPDNQPQALWHPAFLSKVLFSVSILLQNPLRNTSYGAFLSQASSQQLTSLGGCLSAASVWVAHHNRLDAWLMLMSVGMV